MSVAVIHPVRGPAVQAIYATGTVESTVMIPIAPRVASRLDELYVDEGDKVTKGQQLAKLEDQDFVNTLIELRSKETFAKNDYERNLNLSNNNALSVQILAKSKSDWEVSKAATSVAEAQANFLKLVSPSDGVVIKRDGEIGQFIPVNQSVFWIAGSSDLRISADVDEEDISLVAIGQKVLVRADAFPGKIFNAIVKSITPKGDPATRSYRVRIEFTEKTPLKIGMTAEANIIVLEKEAVILIPISCLDKDTIWKFKDGKMLQQKITIGAKALKQVEIINGVSLEDDIVLNPAQALNSKRRLTSKLVEQPK